MVDQSLCPTYQAKSTEDLRLDLNGNVEILGLVRSTCEMQEGGSNLSDRIGSEWDSTCEELVRVKKKGLRTHKLPIGTS